MMVLGAGMGLVMPILTLALQETFPKSELGIVTSSSQFFRQIGGTFGMTVLGAVFNHKSTVSLTGDIEPLLKQIPDQGSGIASRITDMIHTNPQALYNLLYNPATLSQMPAAFAEKIVPMLKKMP